MALRLPRLGARLYLGLPVALAAAGGGAIVAPDIYGPTLPAAAGVPPVLYVPAPPEPARAPRAGGERAMDASASRDPGALPARLRVLVWNVYKGRRPGWADAFAALAADRHLVLIQEAWLPADSSAPSPMRDALLGLDGLTWQMVVSWVDDRGRGPSTGVATGGAVAPLRLDPLVSPEVEPIVATPKTALVTAYPVEGSEAPLVVVNVHALNFVAAGTVALQLDQIERAVAGHAGPLLLAGDFNAWTDDKQAGLRALAGRLGLAEVGFDGLAESADDRTKVFGHPLDYAFVRGLRVDAARVHPSDTSDHAPLLLELSIARP